MGYQSRILIENTGSLVYFVFGILLNIAVCYRFRKYCKKGTRYRKFAERKINDFVGDTIDFLDELYLYLAFALGIQAG